MVASLLARDAGGTSTAFASADTIDICLIRVALETSGSKNQVCRETGTPFCLDI
jgi:hypothetical protein